MAAVEKRKFIRAFMGRALLTSAQVQEIRSIYRRGVHGFGYRVLARRYGTGVATIENIIEGKTWRNLL